MRGRIGERRRDGNRHARKKVANREELAHARALRPFEGPRIGLQGAFMTRKSSCILAILGILTASAHAQQSVPAPTMADAVKVVNFISADGTKIAAYCKLTGLGDQMQKASDAGDQGKVAQLGGQAASLSKALGPAFARLTRGLGRVDRQSNEGRALLAEVGKLDKLCSPK
jgi:hypothetical protein